MTDAFEESLRETLFLFIILISSAWNASISFVLTVHDLYIQLASETEIRAREIKGSLNHEALGRMSVSRRKPRLRLVPHAIWLR